MVQFSQLRWRDYLAPDNPVALALLDLDTIADFKLRLAHLQPTPQSALEQPGER